MKIKNMFQEDINRKINGVVMVDQDSTDVIVQEVEEYVITRDLRKHFITFFKHYSESFEEPVSDIGVWISGFFGSGKSHFLKMLSYILENKVIDGKSTVDRFESKLEDNRDIFELMKASTSNETDTILFNIDIVGPKNKNNTAVLQVFAKMFYNHCGYYGENLKVALMEQYIDSEGKYEDFKASFEKHKGKSWEEQRRAFAFNGNAVKAALVETLGMSESDAQEWFSNKKDESFSIETLVKDIKTYVDKKPEGYRLMFMADEVGQYTGEDTSLLLNLQSIVEEIGSQCAGKVWVVCTGQEAIDEIIKARENEFSRIQARFKTRLSLTSSSVDEVIQERLLKKKPEYETSIKEIYNSNEAVMRNLFSFTDAVLDIKGFGSANDFYKNFPFVPYQFTLVQKCYDEIRKHGHIGKHQTGTERSMLSGFKSSAEIIQDKNEFTLAPFYLFFESVYDSLDHAIRNVVDRAQKAAENGNGLELFDVDLLKLLYLVRYIDDIPANIDNLVILMADDISIDKIIMRDTVSKSLNRLIKENYITRTGDTYRFLTDEEQDVIRDIKNTVVDTANIIVEIGKNIFAGIYPNKKFRYENKYDFPFDQYVDQTAIVNGTGGVCLTILTTATYGADRDETKLILDSKDKATILLAEASYFENLELAMKIRKYVKQLNNFAQRPKSFQDIVRNQTDEAGKLEKEARENLEKAIRDATCYVDGENIGIVPGDAKATIDQVLKLLIERVYSNLNLVDKSVDSDADIIDLLTGRTQFIEGMEPNQGAVRKVVEYLTMQHNQKLPTSMEDIQKRYQSVPYGWREIDVAYVMAQLIADQKVDISYLGDSITADNTKLPDMLRKKTETGKTKVDIHEEVNKSKLKNAREILIEYFDVMDVPGDEKGLVTFVIDKFEAQRTHYEELIKKYEDGNNYPDYNELKEGIELTNDILSKKKDNIALIDVLIRKEEDLFDSKDALSKLESFFMSQVNLFDQGVRFLREIGNDVDYYKSSRSTMEAIDQIQDITTIPVTGKYNYSRIPQLNNLISSVRDYRETLLNNKRDELRKTIEECRTEVNKEDEDNQAIKSVISSADEQFNSKLNDIQNCMGLTLLDGISSQLWSIRDNAITKIQKIKSEIPSGDGLDTPPVVPKNIKSYPKQAIFTSTTLSSTEDVDAYVESIRQKLVECLDGCDGIRIN